MHHAKKMYMSAPPAPEDQHNTVLTHFLQAVFALQTFKFCSLPPWMSEFDEELLKKYKFENISETFHVAYPFIICLKLS